MIQEWKDVPEYEGLYKVSNFGVVKSLKFEKEKILKPQINTKGYFIVNLYKDKKMKSKQIHQLVAITFLNHKPCKLELVVNHINFNKQDNRLDNLEIVTNRVNSNRKHLKSTSKYTGVSFEKDRNKWLAQIRVDGKIKKLGRFDSELDASNAYQKELKTIL